MSKYGFEKIERDISKAIKTRNGPTPQKPELPDSDLDQQLLAYASKELPQPVLYHSLRVFLYSVAAIKDYFPHWELDHTVLFATCLLHDIGTTDKNMKATKMSFEFYGGYVSREYIYELTKDQDFSEAVFEAIIRHQDIGDTGFITTLGMILQLSTLLDNVGANTQYVHPDTVDYINRKYSREGWGGCFASAIDRENSEKPWGHTSQLGIPDFRDGVAGNKHQYFTQ